MNEKIKIELLDYGIALASFASPSMSGGSVIGNKASISFAKDADWSRLARDALQEDVSLSIRATIERDWGPISWINELVLTGHSIYEVGQYIVLSGITQSYSRRPDTQAECVVGESPEC